MSRKPLLFVAIALAQLAVPWWMIRSHERVLRDGEPFRFRTAPIDPRDPFRGEYVRLDFAAERGAWPVPLPHDSTTNELRAYALLTTDAEGFAQVAALATLPPESGSYVDVEYFLWDNDTVTTLQLPFNRFYLEEGDGARTEDLLRPQWESEGMEQPLPSYALVHVLAGKAVIADLFVGDRPIREWLRATPEEAAAWRARFPALPSPADSLSAAVALPAEAP
jgi:uncharacterized membrane-anchored protein